MNKIGFWSLIFIVISSQIGGGTFVIPSAIAQYGEIGILSWILTGVGAICLAMMFGLLCQKIPLTGGPHIYISESFGKDVGFFASWVYWVISWASTPTLIFTITATLKSVMPICDTSALILEISMLTIVTIINLFGIQSSARQNAVFVVMKMIPIMGIFIFGWFFIDFNNFSFYNASQSSLQSVRPTFFSSLNSAALITLWGFIGVESATAPAKSVKDTKAIFRAGIIGTFLVFVIYIVNNFVIYGILSQQGLLESNSAYVDALNKMFGVENNILVPLFIIPVCFASLNTWTIISGQIALGASEIKLLPKIFSVQNKYGSPYISIIISSLGQIPILILGKNKDLFEKIVQVIDFSGAVFLLIYLLSVIVFIKTFKRRFILLSTVNMIFCLWTIYGALSYIHVILLVMSTGIPFYIWVKRESV